MDYADALKKADEFMAKSERMSQTDSARSLRYAQIAQVYINYANTRLRIAGR